MANVIYIYYEQKHARFSFSHAIFKQSKEQKMKKQTK